MLWLLGCQDSSNLTKVETDLSADCTAEFPVGDSFAAALGEPQGCHYRLTASDATTALTLDLPIFADAAAGNEAAATYVLPDDAVRLEATAGCSFDVDVCDEDEGDPTVFYTWEPTSGTVEAAVTPATAADGRPPATVPRREGGRLSGGGGRGAAVGVCGGAKPCLIAVRAAPSTSGKDLRPRSAIQTGVRSDSGPLVHGRLARGNLPAPRRPKGGRPRPSRGVRAA